MDIHKPKPWHGLREFLKEYVIIVVGVLTALAAEQAVEWLHWRDEVAVAREAVRYDMKRILGWAGESDAEAPCKAAALNALRDALDAAQATKQIPGVPWPGGPRTNPWTMRSWAALNSGQVLSHFPNREQLILAGIATQLETLVGWRNEEAVYWSDLGAMAGPARPTSDSEVAALRSALGRAALYGLGQRNGGDQLATLVKTSGFLTQAEMDKAWREGFDAARHTDLCAPPMPPTAETRRYRETWLSRPPRPPGKARTDTLGAAGAVSTEK